MSARFRRRRSPFSRETLVRRSNRRSANLPDLRTGQTCGSYLNFERSARARRDHRAAVALLATLEPAFGIARGAAPFGRLAFLPGCHGAFSFRFATAA